MSSSSNQFSLLFQRRFGFFYLTQFFGAFNDNVFKNALIIMITFQIVDSDIDVNSMVNLSAGLFILPFFLFSALAGQFADKYEKSKLIRNIKLFEVILMLIAAYGFYQQNVALLITILFLMGTQSSIFGPVKYGILPQQLKPQELVGGNALIETGTFLAILLGIIVGGLLIKYASQWVGVSLIMIALLGYASSRGIPIAPAADAILKINWNPFSETWQNIGFIRKNRVVFLSVLGISWFWFLGATYLTQLPNYTRLTLGGNEDVVTMLLALFSIGIGMGSLICERLSGHKVEIGLVPLGSIGLSIFGVGLYTGDFAITGSELIGISTFLHSIGSWSVVISFVMIGFFGGLYIVPLYSLVLERSEESHRSRIIAGNNILNALFMVIASVLAIVTLKAGMSISELFLLVAVMNIVVAIYIYGLMPEFVMRFLVWLLTHSIYRVRKIDLSHIPDRGPAILVCNHVSFVDALIIGGAVWRPVRFVMHYKIFKIPLLSFIFKTAKTIPIAGAREDAKMLDQAFDDIEAALKAGDLVCVFPEGKITADGNINPFKPGVMKMLQRVSVPVIPMALSGLWGSLFSRKDGPIKNRRPRKLFAKITLAAAEAVPAVDVKMSFLEEKVKNLRQEK